MTSGGPYLRIVVPLWHGNETYEPHIPHPALGAVMAAVAPASNMGERLRPRGGEAEAYTAGLTQQGSHSRAHTAGLTQQGLLLHLSYLLLCYRTTAVNTELAGV